MSILMVQYVPYIEPPPSLKKPLKVKVKENNGSGGFGQFVVILNVERDQNQTFGDAHGLKQ